jgi:hypothetical protein
MFRILFRVWIIFETTLLKRITLKCYISEFANLWHLWKMLFLQLGSSIVAGHPAHLCLLAGRHLRRIREHSSHPGRSQVGQPTVVGAFAIRADSYSPLWNHLLVVYTGRQPPPL